MIPADIIAAAQAAHRKWGVPASISIAQWALESGRGAHMPAGSNNPFGIKAGPGQPSVSAYTHEVVHGQEITIKAAFRKFSSIAQAFDLHAELLATKACYAACRAAKTYSDYAHHLTGVYATDPAYGASLIRLIQSEDLDRYDQVATGVAPIQVDL